MGSTGSAGTLGAAGPAPDAGFVEVRVSAPDGEVAESIARALVEERLAACVQVLPRIESTYWWEGEVETAAEVLLVAKTSAGRFEQVCDRVGELHPYDVPEVVAVALTHLSPPYAAWLAAALAPSAP